MTDKTAIANACNTSLTSQTQLKRLWLNETLLPIKRLKIRVVRGKPNHLLLHMISSNFRWVFATSKLVTKVRKMPVMIGNEVNRTNINSKRTTNSRLFRSSWFATCWGKRFLAGSRQLSGRGTWGKLARLSIINWIKAFVISSQLFKRTQINMHISTVVQRDND